MGLGLERPLRDYMKQNVYYMPSGIFNQARLKRTLDIVGVERLIFSTDYPFKFEDNGGAHRFLEAADLSQEDRQ